MRRALPIAALVVLFCGLVLAPIAVAQSDDDSADDTGAARGAEEFTVPVAGPVRIVADGGAVLTVNGEPYDGAIEIAVVDETLQIVDALSVDAWLQGVVDVPRDWPAPVLEAEAIMARTQLTRRLDRNGDEATLGEYDVCSRGTDCPRFLGASADVADESGAQRWADAIETTKGEILTTAGRPALPRAHAVSGGRTRNNADAFGGSEVAYLVEVDSEDEDAAPFHRWSVPIRLDRLRDVLEDGGVRLDSDLVDVRVEQTPEGEGDDVVRLITDDDGERKITVRAFQRAVNDGAPALHPNLYPSWETEDAEPSGTAVFPVRRGSRSETANGSGDESVSGTTSGAGDEDDSEADGTDGSSPRGSSGTTSGTSAGTTSGTTSEGSSEGSSDPDETDGSTGDEVLATRAFPVVDDVPTLPSTMFTVEVDGATATIEGRGFGHGVGLSRWGAKTMADAGGTAEEILGHYYAGISVSDRELPDTVRVLAPVEGDTAVIDTEGDGVFRVESAAGETVVTSRSPWRVEASGDSLALVGADARGARLSITGFTAPLRARAGRDVSLDFSLTKTAEVMVVATDKDGAEAARESLAVVSAGEHEHVMRFEDPGDYSIVVVAESAGGERTTSRELGFTIEEASIGPTAASFLLLVLLCGLLIAGSVRSIRGRRAKRQAKLRSLSGAESG